MVTQESASAQPRRMSSPAIDKAGLVLRAIAEAETPPTFSDLAARVPIARSSLHDVCSSLVRTGLVDKSGDGRYEIGMLVVELSRRRLASMNVVNAFHRAIGRLGAVQETVVLAVSSGADVTYVSFVDSGRPLAVRYEIGMRLPAAFTATGKAMLSTRPMDEVSRLYDSTIVGVNPRQPAKPRGHLIEELADTRRRGYSIDNEETAAGMICIGAPVFSAESDVAVGAVAMSLVKHANFALGAPYTDHITSIARDMTLLLGGDDAWFRRSLSAEYA